MEVAPPHVLTIGSLVPVQKSSPERRGQKEIVAGEERPKFLTTPTTTKTEDSQGMLAMFRHFLSIWFYFSYFYVVRAFIKQTKSKYFASNWNEKLMNADHEC